MEDTHYPTTQLRWVERVVELPPNDGTIYSAVKQRFLQQLWRARFWGEGDSQWRDVPLVEEKT